MLKKILILSILLAPLTVKASTGMGNDLFNALGSGACQAPNVGFLKLTGLELFNNQGAGFNTGVPVPPPPFPTQGFGPQGNNMCIALQVLDNSTELGINISTLFQGTAVSKYALNSTAGSALTGALIPLSFSTNKGGMVAVKLISQQQPAFMPGMTPMPGMETDASNTVLFAFSENQFTHADKAPVANLQVMAGAPVAPMVPPPSGMPMGPMAGASYAFMLNGVGSVQSAPLAAIASVAQTHALSQAF